MNVYRAKAPMYRRPFVLRAKANVNEGSPMRIAPLQTAQNEATAAATKTNRAQQGATISITPARNEPKLGKRVTKPQIRAVRRSTRTRRR